jgi:holliday junction DNA helicase RuvA
MIVQLTGTLVEVLPTTAVLDVGGVGYELGISANTAASLPQAGEAGVTLLTRMIVSQDAVRLYGFATKEERALFDRLVQVAGVGPRLALSVLSTFTPAELYAVVAADDAAGMSRVPGVGKKTAHRLILELQGVFAKDPVLMGLAGKAATRFPLARVRLCRLWSLLPKRLRRRFSPWDSPRRRQSLRSRAQTRRELCPSRQRSAMR